MYLGNPHKVLLGIVPLFLDTPQSLGEWGWDKKGNKVLNRDINHKLTWGTQFQGTQFQLDVTISRSAGSWSFISFHTGEALINVR